MRSMTGFGRARVSRDGDFVSLEVSTVNNRHLDINLPFSTDPELEQKIKDRVKKRLQRGNVDVQVESNILNRQTDSVRLNSDLAEEYVNLANELSSQETNIDEEIDVLDLFSLPGVISAQKTPLIDEESERMFLEALDSALDDVVRMREAEGTKLRKDLKERIGSLRDSLQSIEDRFPQALERYREQLRERFEEALSLEEPELTEELEDEITRYADKCDISEEIVRVDSHITQFKDYLQSGDPVGKNLKFLLQEMQREVNTIGAKGNDAEISQLAVEMKTELEKCREQVKNVE